MLRATLKSLLSRKLRLVLSGLAVVLGVMFVSGAFVLTDTLARSFDNLFATVYQDTDVAVVGKPKVAIGEMDGESVPGMLPAATLDKVRAVPGVDKAIGVVSVDGARVIGSNGKVVTSFGPPRLGGNWTGDDAYARIREGRAPAADNEIVVNAFLAETAGIKVGDQVGVLTREPKRTFTLVGVYVYSGGQETLGGVQEVLFTTPVAQQLMLGEKDVYTSVDVRAEPGVTDAALKDRIAAVTGDDDVLVRTNAELLKASTDSFREALSFFNYILLGFAGVALFVGTFLILNTFSIIVAQRTRELALLRAVGASRRQMIGSVLVEAIVIGLLASVIGLAAGIGVGAGLAWLFGNLGAGGLELAGIAVPAAAVIAAFSVGILITVIAALLPAIRASRIPPIAALQEAATPDRPLTKVTVSGAVVGAAGGTLLGLGLAGTGSGTTTLWLILSGVLVSFIGVALLTPLLSRPLVGLLGRLFSWSVPGKLGRLNSGRNPRRTAITAAALMVGLALITGVNVIIASAKASIQKIADQQIRVDLIISGEGANGMPATFDPAVLDQVGRIDGVQDVVGEYYDVGLVNGERTGVSAITDLPAYARMLSLKPISGEFKPLGPGDIAVDADRAQGYGVKLGDQVRVQLSRGEERTLTIVNVYEDSNIGGGWMMSDAVAKDFRTPQPMMGDIVLAQGASVEAVRQQVDRLLVDNPEVSVADRDAYIDQQASQTDSLVTMVQILLALAILIAVLGVINTLALSVLERTRELGLLRAIGLRRAQTMRMITVESVVISVFGALLGLGVGIGLGASVIRALRDEGFTELALPWSSMSVYLALAALVGVVAAVLPAIRAARVNVLAAIAHE
jgi:putative ABC transport system permease protein